MMMMMPVRLLLLLLSLAAPLLAHDGVDDGRRLGQHQPEMIRSGLLSLEQTNLLAELLDFRQELLALARVLPLGGGLALDYLR